MNVDAALVELQKELDAMLDPLDVPRSWSDRELNAYEEKRALLRQRVNTLSNEGPLLLSLETQLREATVWKDRLVEWQGKLQKELESLPRHQHQTHSQNLLLSIGVVLGSKKRPEDYAYMIETLRLGALMRLSGFTESAARSGEVMGRLPWLGSLGEVENRIKDLTPRRDTAKRRIDEALLTDADREGRAKEDKKRLDALRALPQKKTRGDGSVYLKFPNGEIRELPAS
ncbi:MAG TPA: hypothetical protein VI485_23115 [Vicinamibacterales bacterium]|nr:hypothetical protein [Vicinamibacterales bacterium]